MTMVLSPDVVAKSGEAVKSGPIGLAIILILCIVCYFLFKSMSKHLRTVREQFPPDASAPPAPPPSPVRQLPRPISAEPIGREADRPDQADQPEPPSE
jgi:hypothetical protein